MSTHLHGTRWLPINFASIGGDLTVDWLDWRGVLPIEPFFFQTIQKIRRETPSPAERKTDISVLFDAAHLLERCTPAGVIFHVSRCGSTFLSAGLRACVDSVVLGEAQPVSALTNSAAFRETQYPRPEWARLRRALVDAVITLYGRGCTGAGADPKIVIKTHAASILNIRLFRQLWPSVPFLIVIRDPIEVAASNLQVPAGWILARNRPLGAAWLFGWSDAEVALMTAEEYAARAIGRFCQSAASQIDSDCRVVDYTMLDPERIARIAEWFGMAPVPEYSVLLQHVMTRHSKDPRGKRSFAPDGAAKQTRASADLRAYVEKWAADPYNSLLATAGNSEFGDARPET